MRHSGDEYLLFGGLVTLLALATYIVLIAVARARTKAASPRGVDCEDVACGIFCGLGAVCQILRNKVRRYGCCGIFVGDYHREDIIPLDP